jgi:hypothetical protein
MVGFVGFGDSYGYNLELHNANYYGKIPWPVYLADFDLDKRGAQDLNNRRTVKGGYGLANYVAIWRNVQRYIDDNSIHDSTYFNRLTDFYSAGTAQGYGIGVSNKNNMLRVNKVDTLISFYSAPKRTTLNEVVNGYGIYQEGIDDVNYFEGRVKIGKQSSIFNANDARFFVSDSTNLYANALFGKSHIVYAGGNNNGERANSYHYYLIDFKNASKIADGNHFANRSVLDLRNNAEPDTLFRNQFGNRNTSVDEARIRFNTGSSSTAHYVGENGGVLSTYRARWDWAASFILSSLTYSGRTASFHSLDDFDGIGGGTIEWHSGVDVGQFKSQSGLQFAQKNGIYIRPIKIPQVQKAYAIYQEGAFDTSLFKGIVKFEQPLVLDATITPAGTTGNQTINKSMGAVNIAAAGTSVTVTNSFCNTNSIVFPVIMTNDATAKSCVVVVSAGSFTIHLNAAATGEVKIGWEVKN